jgi:hypothetical protein
MAEARIEEAQAAGRKLMQVVRFDYTVMLVVIVDMVFKPNWTDFVTIAIMAALVAAGAVAFLGNGFGRQRSAA